MDHKLGCSNLSSNSKSNLILGFSASTFYTNCSRSALDTTISLLLFIASLAIGKRTNVTFSSFSSWAWDFKMLMAVWIVLRWGDTRILQNLKWFSKDCWSKVWSWPSGSLSKASIKNAFFSMSENSFTKRSRRCYLAASSSPGFSSRVCFLNCEA